MAAPKTPSEPVISASADDLIRDPVVQLTLRADGIEESEFRELLRAAGWKQARSKAASAPVSPDGAEALRDYRLGAGVMLLNKEGQVFVGRRIDVTSGEAWQMPQGGVEPGEEPQRAALRELKEEIGTANVSLVAESAGWHRYDLPKDLLGRAWHGRWRGQMQKWFVMRFEGDDSEINVETAQPEFSAWKWVAPAEIPKIVVEFKRQLYADLLREFGDKHLGRPR
ncbi:MAG TPA: RNA pyrophosphohydrolase [Bauldia sp.]|nr:RNA pyrophosphohydrolase [Bauldia sp.]